MAKMKKPKPLKVKKPMDPERRRQIRVLCLHGGLAVLLLSGIGAGYHYADRYVEERVAYTRQPLIVVLKNRPPWMNDFLVEQIAAIARPASAHSAFDHQLLVDTANLLAHNPWVRKVHSVRRAYTYKPGDTLEIDCEYRAPAALVKWGAFYWLVDENGIRLSDRFTEQDVPRIQFGPDGHTCIRVIEGIRHTAPHIAGEQWPGEDLTAGLKMLNYLFDRPYADQIFRVNVANLDGRVDAKGPQVVLWTKFNTQVWWGRPPSENDVDAFIEVSTARKLNYLRLAFEQFGRVDGKHQCLDIRFDRVTYPSEEDASATPPPAKSRRSTSH
ncbi:MAG TPA: hypothetical protein VLJ39_10370 [Tepidisphaeraceae bacterium]|nr:hypothetical protein [Tepidisphaeraceae bacterium]